MLQLRTLERSTEPPPREKGSRTIAHPASSLGQRLAQLRRKSIANKHWWWVFCFPGSRAAKSGILLAQTRSRGSLGVASGEPEGGFRVASGWLQGAYRLATSEPEGGLGVASGWLGVKIHHSPFNLLHSLREGGLGVAVTRLDPSSPALTPSRRAESAVCREWILVSGSHRPTFAATS